MSACAGNQAVAVTIRELSVGLLKPRDLMLVLSKEALVGVVNGAVLGTLVGGIAWMMRGKEWPLIGFVVGGAMFEPLSPNACTLFVVIVTPL